MVDLSSSQTVSLPEGNSFFLGWLEANKLLRLCEREPTLRRDQREILCTDFPLWKSIKDDDDASNCPMLRWTSKYSREESWLLSIYSAINWILLQSTIRSFWPSINLQHCLTETLQTNPGCLCVLHLNPSRDTGEATTFYCFREYSKQLGYSTVYIIHVLYVYMYVHVNVNVNVNVNAYIYIYVCLFDYHETLPVQHNKNGCLARYHLRPAC